MLWVSRLAVVMVLIVTAETCEPPLRVTVEGLMEQVANVPGLTGAQVRATGPAKPPVGVRFKA